MVEQRELILQIKNLQQWFPITKGFTKRNVGYVKSIDDISIDLYNGETLGIVGESGCGKSTLAKSIMMLNNLTNGEILLNYENQFKDITKFNKKELYGFRSKVQMIFQDPYSALNPYKKIYTAFDEPLKIHGYKDKNKREEIMHEVLRLVNIPVDSLIKYPHEFSGGQRQRICIARALLIKPNILICDEPVSALDVSIQAQILNLMKDIQEDTKLTYIFIAHDLSVVQYMSDRIAVMYLGKIVEIANTNELYEQPLHPYTKALISAIPIPTLGTSRKKRIVLGGEVPSPINKPLGCSFHERCLYCIDKCKIEIPKLSPYNENTEHIVACHLYG